MKFPDTMNWYEEYMLLHANHIHNIYFPQISIVPYQTFLQGLVITVSGSTHNNLRNSNITFTASTDGIEDPNALPLVQVEVPPFERLNNTSDNVRVTFCVFATSVAICLNVTAWWPGAKLSSDLSRFRNSISGNIEWCYYFHLHSKQGIMSLLPHSFLIHWASKETYHFLRVSTH